MTERGMFLFFLFICLGTNAQNSKYFVENYAWGANQNGYGIIRGIEENTYVIAGPLLDFDGNVNDLEMYVCTINEKGEVLYLNRYSDSFLEIAARKVTQYGDGYLVGGYVNFDTINSSSSYHVTTNIEGEVTTFELVGDNDYVNAMYTLSSTPDGGFIMGGEIQPYDSTAASPPTHPYLIKVDAAGEVEWDTIYWNTQPPKALIIDMDRVPNENAYYLLIQDNLGFYSGNIRLLKINNDGDMLTEHIIDLGEAEAPRALHLTNDGGLLISAGRKVGAIVDGYIIKMDTLGNIIWTNTDYFFRFGPTGNVVELEDGSLILSGFFLHYPPGFGSDVDGELVKLNADGEEIWHRTFGTPHRRPILLRHDRHARWWLYYVR